VPAGLAARFREKSTWPRTCGPVALPQEFICQEVVDVHRSGRKRQPTRKSLGLVLLFLGLGLAGLIVGALFGTYIIRSLIEATTPSGGGANPPSGYAGDTGGPGSTSGGSGGIPGGSTGTPTSVEIVIQPMTFNTVQIGAFSDQAAAQQVASQASDRGLPARIFAPIPEGDKLYRLRCGMTPAKAGAEALQALIRAAGYPEAFINTFTTPHVNLTVQSTSSLYLAGFRDAVRGLGELIQAEGAAWDGYAQGGLDLKILNSHTQAVSTAAGKIRTALSGLTPPADLQERHDVLVGLVNVADAAALQFAEAAKGSQAKYVTAMSEFMRLVDEYSRVCSSWQ